MNETTKPYRPFKMIHKEVFATRAEAREREKYLKSGIGKEFLRSIK
jgi:putative endonuclease